ncbi:hypothetical protein DK26_15225 [Bosea sp. WAO]|uniref:hypothetical protein n=1 Tax=Bosea sp. WAO TaxID=406341 RepID=UPI00074AE0BE|nr:hypothetical protein [Bosea sp. WAO]KUL94357.1 hypothetical protein DK26_15225 [Bosea sp. WAO]
MTNSPKRLPKNAVAASEVTDITLTDVEAGIREAAETARGGYAISLIDAERLGLEPRRDDWSSGEVLTVTALASTGLDIIAERFGLVVSGPYLPPDENEDLYYLVAAPKAA